ncbi:DUF4245 domain-containing protein [Winogradskya humida]|uniref:DUF4245 domain-containing protein n=1 Tax=Winogradskya humida TaxID=113566 RepID=A0ABQ3ZRP4_9ACTN|nr:DUF4245 domain-containing protein [Actinoplanes humidus]GIE21231.1 hypothetical protein Ahu01nite_043330 [Actinoplanes humidus]
MSSTETPAPSTRGDRRPRDMAFSLAILLIPIALLLLFYRFVLDGDKPATADPRPALQEARNAALFEVAEPQGLGKDWHLQTALFRRGDGGGTLRFGYVDPGDKPLQLIESNVATATLIPAELGNAPKATGTIRAGARAWQKYDARKGEVALVLIEKGRTIIVVGSDRSEHLEDLVSSLP